MDHESWTVCFFQNKVEEGRDINIIFSNKVMRYIHVQIHVHDYVHVHVHVHAVVEQSHSLQ